MTIETEKQPFDDVSPIANVDLPASHVSFSDVYHQPTEKPPTSTPNQLKNTLDLPVFLSMFHCTPED